MTDRPAVPVTIIGGYLGAGKTTLINELLTSEHGRRITIVVNDFGAINIDAHLIASRDGDTISLTNGCICCSVAGDLTTELRKLSRANPAPEQIMVEASGVADPKKVANAVRGWSSMRLHQTVTLFDPLSVRDLCSDKFAASTVKRQLRHASMLLAAKLDLVSQGQLASVLEWLGQVAPDASQQLGPLSRSEQISLLLDLSMDAPILSSDESAIQLSASHSSTAFGSLTWSPARPLNEEKLRSLFRDLGRRLQRCKGWVNLDRAIRPSVLVQHGPAGTAITDLESMPVEQPVLVLIYAMGQCSETSLKVQLNACLSASSAD